MIACCQEQPPRVGCHSPAKCLCPSLPAFTDHHHNCPLPPPPLANLCHRLPIISTQLPATKWSLQPSSFPLRNHLPAAVAANFIFLLCITSLNQIKQINSYIYRVFNQTTIIIQNIFLSLISNSSYQIAPELLLKQKTIIKNCCCLKSNTEINILNS